jgi:hypothetical protein
MMQTNSNPLRSPGSDLSVYRRAWSLTSMPAPQHADLEGHALILISLRGGIGRGCLQPFAG